MHRSVFATNYRVQTHMIINPAQVFTNSDTHKHSHPIPDRNHILKLIKNQGNALSREQLANKMFLASPEEKEGLRRRLRAMERDGQVIFNSKQGYSFLSDTDKFEGRVIGHREGYGFLACDTRKEDLLLNQRDMLQLFDGDRILARTSGTDHRGRTKATLVKIIERNTSQVTGQLQVQNGEYFIKPINIRIAQDIDIDKQNLLGAKAGQYVVATLTDYPCHQYRAFAKVTEVIGDENSPGLEIDVVIREHAIPYEWPKTVERASVSFGKQVSDTDKLHRVDLRTLPFVTIDGEDARDFDDAVFCEPTSVGWRLWVAIADVSHYVKPDSELDKEAQKRGTSVYFPGHVIPMLPEALSNGLCSLNPHVDRLVLACEMQINHAGKMTSYQFSEAVIHSHARLTYNQVNALLSSPNSRQGLKMKRNHKDLIPHINALNDVYGALHTARTKRGSIDFDSQEVTFKLDKERKVEKIVPVTRSDAHKLIEECMLCANVATARFLEQLKLPSLYRNHLGPQGKKLESLKTFLTKKQLKLPGGKKPTSGHYNKLISTVSERTDSKIIRSMMLRSLSQAEYSADNKGHFGLGYSAYAHFTSPIRRYPDLLVHRAIRSIIHGHESGNIVHRALKAISGMSLDPVKRIAGAQTQDKNQSYPYKKSDIQALSLQCSSLSRRADKANWDVEAWLKCDYMQNKVGSTFSAIITTVSPIGLFVELDETKIEGLIHISTLKNDFYRYDENNQHLCGERTNTIYKLGDLVKVKVSKVNLEQKKIGFSIVSTTTHKKSEN